MGIYFLPISIMLNVTKNSATSVAMAAPSCEREGTRHKLSIKFDAAPIAVQIITIFSFPCGYNICIPKMLDKLIRTMIGDISCKVVIAAWYVLPQNKMISFGARIIVPTVMGNVIAQINSVAF